MNKILLIIVIAAAIIAGISIAYALKLEPAVTLVDEAKAQFAELTAGGIDAQTLLTSGSIAGVGVSAVSAYNQFKGKVTAQTSAAKEALQKTGALQQVQEIQNSLTTTKETLTSQLSEVTKIKDTALAEAEAAKTQAESLKDQLERQVQQTQTASQMNTNTIQNLWKNSGGDWWTDPVTKEKFKLLSLVTEKVI